MLDVFATLDIFIDENNKLRGKLETRSLEHDERITLRGSDLFDKYKKILLIFKSFHLHLYYKITLDEIRRFESIHDYAIDFSNLSEYVVETNTQTINNSLFFFIECVVNLMENHIYRIDKRENLSSVITSDPHGDLIAFLIPLRLSGNFQIFSIIDGVVKAKFSKGVPCIFNGDYYSQRAEYYTKMRKLHLSIEKARIVQERLDSQISTLIHEIIIKTIWAVVLATIYNLCNVWFLLGNHDTELFNPLKLTIKLDSSSSRQTITTSVLFSRIFIVVILKIRDRLYIIQHGFFNTFLYEFVPKGFEQKPDMELTHIIYTNRNRVIQFQTSDISIAAISYASVKEEISRLNKTYFINKLLPRIKASARDETHLKFLITELKRVEFQEIGIRDLFQTKKPIDASMFKTEFNNFLYSLSFRDILKAFLVLGHSKDYIEISLNISHPFQSMLDIREIKKTNDIFMNILTLDSKSNSYMNEYVFQSVQKPLKKGGTSQNIKSIIFSFLIIVCLLISIIYFIQRNGKPIFSYTNTRDRIRSLT